MEIVIEESLFISIFLNFLILKVTSCVLSKKARLTFVVSSGAGIINLFAPILIMSVWLKLCFILCLILLMILISFKYKSLKDYMITCLVFIVSTFIFGGGCFALKQLIGSFPLFVVAVVGSILFIAIKFIVKVVNHHRRNKKFTYSLTLKDGGKEIIEQAYLDSGNMLYDSITKKPIILINFDVFQKIYSDISLMSVLTKKIDFSSIKNGHYIKINGVGKGTSILVFTIDELKIDGDERLFKNATLGLSFAGFEKSFGKNILLHCDYS